MLRPIWLIPTLLSFTRPRRSVAWSSSLSRWRGGGAASPPPFSHPHPRGILPSFISSSSARTASVTDDADTTASLTPPRSSDNADDDQPKQEGSHTAQSLALDLPMATFGGLPYWNTQHRKAFRVVFVLGGPGAGKGTQSTFLETNFPVAHFSVGELLRAEQMKGDDASPHAALIAQALVAGQIVPVEISLGLLRQAMQDKADHEFGPQSIFLVDGFPRNHDNLSGWCRFMTSSSSTESTETDASTTTAAADLWGVLVYTCPEQVLEARILERAKESGRSDDNVESVRKRFRTFQEQTQPIIDELDTISKQHKLDQDDGSTTKRANWKVWQISGDQPLPDVTAETRHMMNQLIRNDILTANQGLLDAIAKGDVQAYEALCDPELLRSHSNKPHTAQQVMEEHEGPPRDNVNINIAYANIEFITGKHAIVTYTRQLQGQTVVREARVWMHQGQHGWRSVHFSRTPITNE